MPAIEWLTNKFVWYGTTRRFDCLTLTFRENGDGVFVAHHYRYAPERSTFIVECDAATWRRAGFATMDDAASRAYCERLFAPDLDGHPLIANRSTWRNFPLLSNARWSAGNVVLIGDALRTGHFSIGSGTRLAFDDAIALDRALAEAGDDVPRLIAAFERERRPVVDKLVAAANSSSYWYERMADKMALSPVALAYDYMTRSGRVDDVRLADMAPRFMSHVTAGRADGAFGARDDARIVDPVPDDLHCAQEIGFAVPDRYNASALLYDNLPQHAGKVALICGERRVTYGELCALADRAGAGLCQDGACARRPGADAARRHARIRCGDLRRDPGRLRARAREHAVAAGPGRVFPAGQRRRGRVRRRALRNAARPRRRRREPPAAGRGGRKSFERAEGCARHRSSLGHVDRRATGRRSSPSTRTATTWRSGCTARAPRAGRRASSICSTTRCTRGSPTAVAFWACARTTSCSRRRRSSSPTASATR
jgi:hypothetical protein